MPLPSLPVLSLPVASSPSIPFILSPIAKVVAASVTTSGLAADRVADVAASTQLNRIAPMPPVIDDIAASYRPRGTKAGIRKQQNRFMRVLYQLSSAQ
ncbi:hypothetical protein X777_16237 [Ooceraea biroi]|uniref:Uncharacterized protein n=1 Tax=Ooceraea biroi TaxID=2015173 RepID=A0A026WVR5_OOCBI|nr:hypothetical protein X777_16237 [Ooceraea biroi]